MIQSLREKFIVIATVSLLVVLTVIVAIMNISNYHNVVVKADRLTSMLSENNGEFDKESEPRDDGEKKALDKKERPDDLSPETPFITRYFTVILDEDGEVVSSDTENIAAIDSQEAEEYGQDVYFSGKEMGFKEVYRYRVITQSTSSKVIFVDCDQELRSFRTFAITSVVVAHIGMLAVFILVFVASKIVFKPVQESYEKQKQFITDASHEIKTPLTIIDANTEVMEMETGENQWTKSTRNQVRRLTDLTKQLITLSKLDEKEGKIDKIKFSLSEAVADSVYPFDAPAKAMEKRLFIDIDENMDFTGDEEQIRRLVGILMDNALKYSSKKSEIKISLKQKSRKVYLTVENQTESIPKGNLDILFERFYRMDTSRNSETGGSGIGLSVAKAIVTAHKGRITAYSSDGKSICILSEFKI